MEKVLVRVYVPIIEKSFDILIPRVTPIYEVLELIKTAVSKLSDGQFVPTDSSTLCIKSTGEILDINRSADSLGLTTGLSLMLI